MLTRISVSLERSAWGWRAYRSLTILLSMNRIYLSGGRHQRVEGRGETDTENAILRSWRSACLLNHFNTSMVVLLMRSIGWFALC